MMRLPIIRLSLRSRAPLLTSGTPPSWILLTGFWNDSGVWYDTATWNG